jgi:hypothetical protein
MALLIREYSGIVCLCLAGEKVKALGLVAGVELHFHRLGVNAIQARSADLRKLDESLWVGRTRANGLLRCVNRLEVRSCYLCVSVPPWFKLPFPPTVAKPQKFYRHYKSPRLRDKKPSARPSPAEDFFPPPSGITPIQGLPAKVL